MKNPCRRDGPDRAPGCNCERRKAWKWQQAQIREARDKHYSVRFYFRDASERLRRRGYFPKKK